MDLAGRGHVSGSECVSGGAHMFQVGTQTAKCVKSAQVGKYLLLV
jgi:hypothetical protein